MATIATKRKLNIKSVKGKYNALKGVEIDSPKSKIAFKYGIPRKIQLVVKQVKIFDAVKKGGNSICRRLRDRSFANLHQSIFKWGMTVNSRAVVLPVLILKNKAMDFAKK